MATLWVCVAKSRQMLTELTIFGTQKALASLLTPKFNLRISDLPRQCLNGNLKCCPSHLCSPTSSALGSHSRQSMGRTQWETCPCSPRLVLSNHSMVPCAYSVVNKVTHLWYSARLLSWSLHSLRHPVFEWVLYTCTYYFVTHALSLFNYVLLTELRSFLLIKGWLDNANSFDKLIPLLSSGKYMWLRVCATYM